MRRRIKARICCFVLLDSWNCHRSPAASLKTTMTPVAERVVSWRLRESVNSVSLLLSFREIGRLSQLPYCGSF
jgi:hypothetical protein